MKIIGIGNAIVDVICKVNEDFIYKNNLTKGTMKLTFDENEFKTLLSKLKIEKTVAGGSVANSIVGLSQLNNKVGFIGKINDDENPPVAVADTYGGSNCVDEGGKLTISDPAIGLLANDYDPENGPLSIKVKAPTILGLIQCNGLPGICSDGTFEFIHGGDQTIDSQVQFSYEIEDEDGFKAVGLVTICVNPVNDPPFISNGAIQLNEGETVTRDFTTGIQDEEYTLGLDNGFSFKILTPPSKGVATLTAQGILTYTAPDYLSGGNPFNTSLMYEYTDGGGLTTTNIVPITIANSVPAPVADTFYVGVNQTINIYNLF